FTYFIRRLPVVLRGTISSWSVLQFLATGIGQKGAKMRKNVTRAIALWLLTAVPVPVAVDGWHGNVSSSWPESKGDG
ncbi:MAG: hypothetical protein ACYTBZ_27015, partial [Planctomycetota bacterium]